jgi:pimeloyl-ACP methyl ester carboxylesterase
MAPFLERGWVVVASDYEGMGGPGIHPYVVGESEARGVFDIVRAAQSMPGVGADGPLVVWGHSQGGHAAMHVAERWQDLAPDLDLVGVAAGAPPSQFPLLSAFLQGSAYQGYLVMAAAGMAATYDELDLKAVINPAKLHLMDELEKGCTGHIFDVFNEIPYEDLLSVDDIFAIPAWNARLMENDTNQLPNQVPVVILHGDLDQQIPVLTSAALFAQLCAFADHAPLERRVYEGEDHGSVVPAYLDDLTAWLEARVAGEPATDQCGT